MNTIPKQRNNAVLIFMINLIFFGLLFSCAPDESFENIAEVTIQIQIPESDNLKSAASVTTIRKVIIRVTAGGKILDKQELNITGNTARGVLSVTKGEKRTFTVEAMDENDIIQWLGSTTRDINDDLTIDIEMEPVLPEVSNLQAAVAENAVNISWSQNSDNDFGRYVLYRSLSEDEPGDSLFSTSVAGETEFRDNFVSEGQSYFYTLLVFDTEGLTATSNVIQVDVPVTYLLPVNLVVVSTDSTRVVLSWSKNNEPDFAGYELQRSSEETTGEIIFSTSVATDTTYTDNDVTEGNTYFYTCLVTDTAGYSTNSNQVQVDIPLIPPTPSILEAAYDGYVYLSWSENPDSDFSSYEVFRSEVEDESGESIFSGTDVSTTEFVDENVVAGGIYYYTVVVYDLDRLSSKSNAVEITIPRIPPTPVTLTYDFSSNSELPNLFWTPNTDSDFARYELYRLLSGNDTWERIYSTADISETFYLDESVEAGNTYSYKLIVFDTEELSAESNTVQLEISAPGMVYLEGFQEGDYAYLYWKESSDSDFLRYDLYRSQSQNFLGEIVYTSYRSSDTQFHDQGVSEGNTYYYTVVVYYTNGFYAESNEIKVILDANPPSPVELTGEYQIVDSLLMIGLRWSENNDLNFDRYELYRSGTDKDIGTIIFSTNKITNTYFEDTNIKYNSIYFYTIVVYDKSGLSATSNIVRVLTP